MRKIWNFIKGVVGLVVELAIGVAWTLLMMAGVAILCLCLYGLINAFVTR